MAYISVRVADTHGNELFSEGKMEANGKVAEMPASQEFRDGVATGVALMERRLRRIKGYGVYVDYETFGQVAAQITNEYGGDSKLAHDEN